MYEKKVYSTKNESFRRIAHIYMYITESIKKRRPRRHHRSETADVQMHVWKTGRC